MARIMVDFAMVNVDLKIMARLNVNLKIEEIDMKMLRVVDCGRMICEVKG